MFNDFLGEVIAESTRNGQVRKPNQNNPVTKARKKLERSIKNQARELGKNENEVALEYVNQNIGDVQRFVATKGEQPLTNPAELATQAYILKQKEVAETCRILGCSKEEAQTFLEEAEANAANVNSSEADNFIGPLLAALAPVAQTGAQKIAEDRKAKGKKGGIWDILAAGSPAMGMTQPIVPTDSGNGIFGGVKVFAQDVIDKIKETEKKKEIKKMLPIIIGAALALILLTALITRNVKSK